MTTVSYLKTYEELNAALQQRGLTLPISEDLSFLGKPLTFGAKKKYTLANRFVAHPMEGFDSGLEGEPGDLCFRRYSRFAAGGASLIWFEATAIIPEARCNSQQLWLHEKNVRAFADLLDKTKKTARETCGHEVVTILQLTHSGRFSKPRRGERIPIPAQHNDVLDAVQKIPTDYPRISDDDLDRLQDAFVRTAKLAAQCGFDGVDVKASHGYLLNELLGARTRKGKYGGTFENRTRFLRETISRIQDEIPNLFVTSRLSAYDAIKYPWGFCVDEHDYKKWDLTESKRLVADLKAMGVPLLSITIGVPFFNPHYNRPYAKQARSAVAYDEHPLIGVCRFVEIVRDIQVSQPDMPIVGAGLAWLRHLMPRAAAGIIATGSAQLVGQGRGSFAYPDAPKDVLAKGEMDTTQVCVACSGCTELMRQEKSSGCIIRDRSFYTLNGAQ